MAEAGNPQPDGPRPPSPRTRGGDRRRDPVALAAWRRVAEQRRRATDPEAPAFVVDDVPAMADPAGSAGLVVDPAPVTADDLVPVTADDLAPVTADDLVPVVADDLVPVVADPAVPSAAAVAPPVVVGSAAPVVDAGPAVVGGPVPPVADDVVPTSVGDAVPADAARVAVDGAARAAADGARRGAPNGDRAGGPNGERVRAAVGDPVGADGDTTGAGGPVARESVGTGGVGGPSPDPTPARAGSGDGPPPVGRLHDVLLGLAGRLDDDALTTVREMVAAEDDAEAAELLGGCLLAGGVGLTTDERSVLRPWFTAARVDHDLLGLLPADSGALSRSVHRFAPTVGDRAPGLPVARAARRLPGVLAVRESWRVTPAGSAPGPVPHRVVLVETAGPDDCDHVVHHLAHAARSLDDTSVEVFASGATLPVYHREALAAARPLFADEPAAGSVAARQPAPRAPERPVLPRFGPVDDDETWRTVADAGTARTGSVPTVTPAPAHDDPEEPGLEDLDESADVALDAGTDAVAAVAPAAAPRTSVDEPVVADAPEPETSIDDDLSSTARRIAALWARPAPEDFSAPLAEGSLEPTRLEPADDGPASREVAAPEVEEQPEADDEPPSGRHGRFAATDLGTTSFRSPRSRTNGHRVERVEDEAADTGDLEISASAPATGAAIPEDDQSDDDAQVQRARHSRARDGDSPLEGDPGPARFGHDARYGAGAGPAWPGGPVSENSGPGPDTLFASPVDVGGEPVAFGANGHRHAPELVGADDEPVTLGTNGHRHEPVAAGPDDEPATGPVAWSGPASPPQYGGPPAGGPPAGQQPPGAPRMPGPPANRPPMPGPPPPGAAGPAGNGPVENGSLPRRPAHPGEDVAPPWAAANGAGWPSETPGWTPGGDAAPARPPEPESTASWSPDLDDSVAQLSDRERELLARLHEELAQRERAEGADPFAGPPRPPSDRAAPPQPPQAQPPGNPGPRRPRPGPPPGPPPGGRVNGHGLPGSPDDTGA